MGYSMLKKPIKEFQKYITSIAQTTDRPMSSFLCYIYSDQWEEQLKKSTNPRTLNQMNQ